MDCTMHATILRAALFVLIASILYGCDSGGSSGSPRLPLSPQVDPFTTPTNQSSFGLTGTEKAPIDLQDLRRRIYVKVKAEPSWRLRRGFGSGSGGVGDGCARPWTSSMNTRSRAYQPKSKAALA